MGNGQSHRFSAWQAIGFQSSLAVLALLLLWLFSIPVWNEGLPVLQAVCLGSLAALITYAVLFGAFRLPGFRSLTMERHLVALRRFTLDYSWPVLIALAALAGAGEELLFRAVIQGWPAAQGYPLSGLLAGALLFGLAHFLSLTYFALATLLGLVLGFAYLYSESLWLVMIWHGVYDLIAIYTLRQHPALFGLTEQGSR